MKYLFFALVLGMLVWVVNYLNNNRPPTTKNESVNNDNLKPKSTMEKDIRTIRNWVTFFGVIVCLQIVTALIYLGTLIS